MQKILLVALLLPICWSNASARPHSEEEGCHVYIVNEVLALKMADRMDECVNDAKKCGVTEFPSFMPTLGEEEEHLRVMISRD